MQRKVAHREVDISRVNQFYGAHDYLRLDLNLLKCKALAKNPKYQSLLSFLKGYNDDASSLILGLAPQPDPAIVKESLARSLASLLHKAIHEPSRVFREKILDTAVKLLVEHDLNFRNKLHIQRRRQPQPPPPEHKRPLSSTPLEQRTSPPRPMTALGRNNSKINRPFSGAITLKSTSPSELMRSGLLQHYGVEEAEEGLEAEHQLSPSEYLEEKMAGYKAMHRTLHKHIDSPEARVRNFKCKAVRNDCPTMPDGPPQLSLFLQVSPKARFESRYEAERAFDPDEEQGEERQSPEMHKIDDWPLKSLEDSDYTPKPQYVQTTIKGFQNLPDFNCDQTAAQRKLSLARRREQADDAEGTFCLQLKKQWAKSKSRIECEKVRRIESAKVKVQSEDFLLVAPEPSAKPQGPDEFDLGSVAPLQVRTKEIRDRDELRHLEGAARKSHLKRVVSANLRHVGSFERLVESEQVELDYLSLQRSASRKGREFSAILADYPADRHREEGIREVALIREKFLFKRQDKSGNQEGREQGEKGRLQVDAGVLTRALLGPEECRGEFALPNYKFTMMSNKEKSRKKKKKARSKNKSRRILR